MNKKPSGGLTPEEARKILEKNPALRKQGKDTSWIVARAAAAVKGAAANAPVARDFYTAVVETRSRLRRDLKSIDEQIAALEEQKKKAREKSCVELFAWLEAHDKALGQKTRDTIEDEASFLKEIGFSEARYKKGNVT